MRNLRAISAAESCAPGRAGEFEHAVEREQACSSAASRAIQARSFSSGMKVAAIMPWLRKNDRTRRLSRASSVRTLSTPSRLKPSQIASSSCVATPDEARVRPHADAEHPAAGRRAEFPVAHVADDVAVDPSRVVGDQEETLLPSAAVAPQDLAPVRRLAQPRNAGVDFDHLFEVAGLHARGCAPRRASRPRRRVS